MAESTSVFLESTTSYILKNGYLLNDISIQFGVSKYAIIGAIANEYDARYAYGALTVKGEYFQKLADAYVAFENSTGLVANLAVG